MKKGSTWSRGSFLTKKLSRKEKEHQSRDREIALEETKLEFERNKSGHQQEKDKAKEFTERREREAHIALMMALVKVLVENHFSKVISTLFV